MSHAVTRPGRGGFSPGATRFGDPPANHTLPRTSEFEDRQLGPTIQTLSTRLFSLFPLSGENLSKDQFPNYSPTL